MFLIFQTDLLLLFFFFHDTATTGNYTYSHTLSLHDALPISRANWRPNIGAPITDTLPVPPNKGAGLRSALDAGEQVARQYKGGNNSPTVHITNSLPYIKYLNDGSSKQAPRNFVNTAILLAVSAIRQARIVDIR